MNMMNRIASIKSMALHLLRDEQGGEVVETALVLGFICLAAIGMMSKVGKNALLKWTSLADQM